MQSKDLYTRLLKVIDEAGTIQREVSGFDLCFERSLLEPLRINLQESLSKLIKRVLDEVQAMERELSEYRPIYKNKIPVVIVTEISGKHVIKGDMALNDLKSLNTMLKKQNIILPEDFSKITQDLGRLIEEGKLGDSLHIDVEELVYKKIHDQITDIFSQE